MTDPELQFEQLKNYRQNELAPMQPMLRKPEAPYSPLSMYIMSCLLAENGVINLDSLQAKMKCDQVKVERAIPFIEKTLAAHRLVELQDDMITSTAGGVEFIAQHTDCIEQAEVKAAAKKPIFPQSRYVILGFIYDEAGPGGKLLQENNATMSVYKYLGEKLPLSQSVITKRVNDAKKLELLRAETLNGVPGGFTVNMWLTLQGETEVEEMRARFPKKVALLEEAVTGGSLGSSTVESTQQTLVAITDEINHMLEELGEAPKDFTNIRTGDMKEMQAAIERLRPVTQALEERIDQRAARWRLMLHRA